MNKLLFSAIATIVQLYLLWPRGAAFQAGQPALQAADHSKPNIVFLFPMTRLPALWVATATRRSLRPPLVGF